MVHGPDHAGFHESVLAAVRLTGRLHPGGDGQVPVVLLPVGVAARGAEDLHEGDRVVPGVVGLLPPHDLERIDLGLGVLAASRDGSQLDHLGGSIFWPAR